MVVPNTPNPVDGGNVEDKAGSTNHWQTVIDDLSDYDTAGGGAGPNWHGTAASLLHETTHWTADYVADSVNTAAGGDWPKTNKELDALQQPKAVSAVALTARTALKPKVEARLQTWRAATVARWNTLITTKDKPGSGGRGYAAGKTILDQYVTSIRAYAQKKGWTKP